MAVAVAVYLFYADVERYGAAKVEVETRQKDEDEEELFENFLL